MLSFLLEFLLPLHIFLKFIFKKSVSEGFKGHFALIDIPYNSIMWKVLLNAVSDFFREE